MKDDNNQRKNKENEILKKLNCSNLFYEEKEEKLNNKDEKIKEIKEIKEEKEIKEIKEDNKDKYQIKKGDKNIKDSNSKSNHNMPRSVVISKSKYNLIKIEPHKKDEDLNIKEKEIMESINLFIDDFKDGKKVNIDNNNLPQANVKLELNEKKEEQTKLQSKPSNNKLNNNKIAYIKKNLNIKENISNFNGKKEGTNIEYIDHIKYILYHYNIPIDFKVKIKCRIKTFFHSYDNFYKGCSICSRKLKDNAICCKNGKKKLYYNFYLNARDASGVVTIFFFDEIGRQLMGIDAEIYKKYLDDNQPIGKIVLSEFINDFYENEYIFTINFIKSKNKDTRKKYKYKVIKVEKVNKSHIYQMVNELKCLLH